jgi:MerR family transcriptional regulator, thiopeptide resistance regulator
MKGQRTFQVREVAEIAGVSVRALHHYDAIGLLVPKVRSDAGYRLYDEDDLLRLQQILIGRELGLPLEEIRRLLDDPELDRRQALVEQRAKLEQRLEHTAAMIRAVDAALSLLGTDEGGETMNMKDLFNGFDHSRYEEEARQRWGHTDAYKESTKRVSRYTPEDWKRHQAEQASIYGDAYAALSAGKAPDSVEAMDVAERHRLAIERWFYPCPHDMHVGLADMYEADSRFAENIDKFGAGLTAFLSAAIRANARRHGATAV